MRVGFIGLGSQGAPMARRIVEGGYPTTLWARRPAALEPFADTAAVTAASPAALAARSDLVCLCVVGDADVREVVTGDNGVLAGLAPGSIIAVHSTVHPDTCRELAESAAAQQVAVIDAPVSGGGAAAAGGRGGGGGGGGSRRGGLRGSRPRGRRSPGRAGAAARVGGAAGGG
ncbi:NAD(P)-dependent oxidoreductase, partial [Nocardia abscessus]|uniref:NAD(P)-dependent oxidoreductase n=1 Tax=Nocardia abscessus TaxID=120957 RepID=UPI0024581F32